MHRLRLEKLPDCAVISAGLIYHGWHEQHWQRVHLHILSPSNTHTNTLHVGQWSLDANILHTQIDVCTPCSLERTHSLSHTHILSLHRAQKDLCSPLTAICKQSKLFYPSPFLPGLHFLSFLSSLSLSFPLLSLSPPSPTRLIDERAVHPSCRLSHAVWAAHNFRDLLSYSFVAT